jgi:glutamate racemase
VRVVTQPCPGLVELIEAGDLNDPTLHGLLRGYVEPLLAEGCDTLILGCTHYPFLRPLLERWLDPSISLIDTGGAVARQLQRLLASRDLLANGPRDVDRFWCSGEPAAMQRVLPQLWGSAEPVAALPEN